jgi:hypothetical protein
VLSHERYVEELTTDFERKLDEERQSRMQLEEERAELEDQLTETQNQLEDDIDTEIENMKRLNEEKLAVSRETTLKYKGENGIMKKKSVLMQRDIEDQKEEMKNLLVKEKELHDQIKLLEKEVSAHKKEIKTRDVSIGDKEKRIYELKKKNQELDKFKFVLDYKIRELKQQIEPRQLEIMAMREKIKDMDTELEKYHKSNAALDGMIGELRAKIDALQNDVRAKRTQAKTSENTISACRSDIQSSIAHIQTHNLLVAAVKNIVETYGSMDNLRPHVDREVQEEYARHKEYLHRTIQDLKKALEEGSLHHMATNNQIRTANMSLIGEINTQRESNRLLKNHVQAEIGRIRHFVQSQNMKKSKKGSTTGGGGSGSLAKDGAAKVPGALYGGDSSTMGGGGGDSMEPGDLLEKNRRRIAALRAALAELEAKARGMSMKAVSREVLPPMDGVGMAGVSGGGSSYAGENGYPPQQQQQLQLPVIGNNNNSQGARNYAGTAAAGIVSDSLGPTPYGEEDAAAGGGRGTASGGKRAAGAGAAMGPLIELPAAGRPGGGAGAGAGGVAMEMADSIVFSPSEVVAQGSSMVPMSPDGRGDTYTTQYVEPAQFERGNGNGNGSGTESGRSSAGGTGRDNSYSNNNNEDEAVDAEVGENDSLLLDQEMQQLQISEHEA